MIKTLLLLVTVSCISLSDACSCIPLVKKDAYCNSAFAGTIKVLSSGISCESSEKCYSISVVQQFRGTPITSHVLQTHNSSAACGVTLIQGYTYFVAATPIDSNTLRLGSCQLNENWTEFSGAQLANEIQEYRSIQCSAV